MNKYKFPIIIWFFVEGGFIGFLFLKSGLGWRRYLQAFKTNFQIYLYYRKKYQDNVNNCLKKLDY